MSNTVAAAIVIIIGLGPLVYLFRIVWRVFTGGKASQTEAEPQTVSRSATVLKKDMDLAHTGTIHIPDHEIRFAVCFRLENGDEVWYKLPKAVYDRISEGETGPLVTVGREIVDFNGYFGTES